eukprot:UN02041
MHWSVPVAAQSVRYSSNLAKNPTLVKTPAGALYKDRFDPEDPLKSSLFTWSQQTLLKYWVLSLPAIGGIYLQAAMRNPNNMVYRESNYSIYKKKKAAEMQ